MISRTFTLSLFLLIFVCSGIAQQNQLLSANQLETTDNLLRNLKLDESTVDDAIKILGKPKSDTVDVFGVGGKNGIFETSIEPLFLTKNEKVFRKLVYKKKAELMILHCVYTRENSFK